MNEASSEVSLTGYEYLQQIQGSPQNSLFKEEQSGTATFHDKIKKGCTQQIVMELDSPSISMPGGTNGTEPVAIMTYFPVTVLSG